MVFDMGRLLMASNVDRSARRWLQAILTASPLMRAKDIELRPNRQWKINHRRQNESHSHKNGSFCSRSRSNINQVAYIVGKETRH